WPRRPRILRAACSMRAAASSGASDGASSPKGLTRRGATGSSPNGFLSAMVRFRSTAVEHGRALLQESRDALLLVLARERGDERLTLVTQPGGERHLERRPDGLLGELERHRRVPRDGPCELVGARRQILIVYDEVDEADPFCLLRVDHLASQDHTHGAAESDQARQPLRAAAAREDPELDLGLTQA